MFKPLCKRVLFLLHLALFWLTYFVFTKLLFVLYNISLAKTLSVNSFFGLFYNGFKLDLSATGYIILVFGTILSILFFVNGKKLKYVVTTLSIILIVIFNIMFITDAELYRNWGFRTDSSVLLYLKNPAMAVASSSRWLLAFLFIAYIVFCYLFFVIYKFWIQKKLLQLNKMHWATSPVLLLFTALSIIVIRGGFGIAPINAGSVYFSNNTFANHAAINLPWNFANSFIENKKSTNMVYFDNNKAQSIFNNLVSTTDTLQNKVLKVKKPNVLIIVLESFTAKAIEPLGGLNYVTPNLNQLCSQGILFTKCYSSGDRSDKGLAAVLSGYPAQPKTSIVSSSKKSQYLPHLSKQLMQIGHKPYFYYGGDINFANLRQYFITGNYNIVTQNNFDNKLINSKWGVHDQHLFNRLFTDINSFSDTFFVTAFTLSSHEPFTVPMQTVINGDSEEQKFLNSMYYTDSCLGSFIDSAKQTHWWKNTLIVLIGDHGSRHPGNTPSHKPQKFHIPMLWLGGALAVTDTIVDSYVSQIDLPKMIANQLGADGSVFKFSKDIFCGHEPFSWYAFNNGFGIIDTTGYVIFDNNSMTVIDWQPVNNNILVERGQSFMQIMDYNYNNAGLIK